MHCHSTRHQSQDGFNKEEIICNKEKGRHEQKKAADMQRAFAMVPMELQPGVYRKSEEDEKPEGIVRVAQCFARKAEHVTPRGNIPRSL